MNSIPRFAPTLLIYLWRFVDSNTHDFTQTKVWNASLLIWILITRAWSHSRLRSDRPWHCSAPCYPSLSFHLPTNLGTILTYVSKSCYIFSTCPSCSRRLCLFSSGWSYKPIKLATDDGATPFPQIISGYSLLHRNFSGLVSTPLTPNLEASQVLYTYGILHFLLAMIIIAFLGFSGWCCLDKHIFLIHVLMNTHSVVLTLSGWLPRCTLCFTSSFVLQRLSTQLVLWLTLEYLYRLCYLRQHRLDASNFISFSPLKAFCIVSIMSAWTMQHTTAASVNMQQNSTRFICGLILALELVRSGTSFPLGIPIQIWR